MEKPFLFNTAVLTDHRGIFSPTPVKFDYKNHLSLRTEWLQTNLSVNDKAFTFRGLHFQDPYPQAKLVKVIKGSIIDFIVDLREGDLSVYKYKMEAGATLFVPKGFAHGFITLEPNTIVQYLVDEMYFPQHEHSINWLSFSEISNEIYSLTDEVIISDKDENAPGINEYIY